jgi:hypothetical protein
MIKGILDINPQTRFSLDEIKKHEFYKLHKGPPQSEGIIIGYHKIPVKKKLIFFY